MIPNKNRLSPCRVPCFVEIPPAPVFCFFAIIYFEITPGGSRSVFEFTALGPRVCSVEIPPGGAGVCFLNSRLGAPIFCFKLRVGVPALILLHSRLRAGCFSLISCIGPVPLFFACTPVGPAVCS